MEVGSLSGLDKAAILFQVLGDGLAVTIFKEISDTQMRKVRVRAREVTAVPFKVKKAVLEEFYFGFLAEKFKDSSAEGKKPFAFMDKLSDEQVAYLVLAEPPRIAGMVLAQLNPERQMRVYERMDPEQRVEALMELGDTEGMNLEAVVSIASDLREKARFLPKASQFERGSGKKLAEMLGQMGLDQAELFLDKLGQENPELLRDVKRFYLTFDDVFGLPETALRDILMAVDLDDLAMAFKGSEDEVVEAALESLPQKKQAMYEPIERTVTKREVNEARAKVMKVIRDLEKAGELNIADLLSEDTVD
ncbi:FliG C-terminal domain-containing protein [Candidatus Neomarinimicrobiota bacterium]